MAFADNVAQVLASAGLTRPRGDKAEMRRMAAAAYEAAHARRAAELGAEYRPGMVFNCALDMFRGDD